MPTDDNDNIQVGRAAMNQMISRPPGIDIADDRDQIQDRAPSKVSVAPVVGTNPWDRQPDESDQAWFAFQMYRDMGPSIRGTGNIARDLGHELRTTARWCAKYHWQDRAATWDGHLDRIAQRAFEIEAETMGRRHAGLGMKLQVLGAERIGEYAEKPELKGTITVREALEITKAGVAIEREARASDKSKSVGGAGTIIFNLNMGGKAPKWAPKTIQGGAVVLNANENESEKPESDAENEL